MSYYICPQCGADIETENGYVCEYCGFELEVKTCVKCGKKMLADADICPDCGAEQTEKTDAPAEDMIISNVPQSPDINSTVFEDAAPQIFGHEEEVEEILDEDDEIIEEEISYDEETAAIESDFYQKTEALVQEPVLSVNDDIPVPSVETPVQEKQKTEHIEEPVTDTEPGQVSEEIGSGLNIGHEEEVQYMNYSEMPEKEEEEPPVAKQEGQTCKKCGFVNPGIAKFCLGCGTPLEEKEEIKGRICPECGFENMGNAKFCMVCGARFPEEEVTKVAAEEKTESKTVKKTPVSKAGDTEIYFKAKINYDNNNKFQYKFVFNKIKEMNPEISDSELKMFMNNNIFMVDIKGSDFDNFKSELEDLDCTVEKISESVGKEAEPEETEESPAEPEITASGYSLLIKGMAGHEPGWKSKFVKMLMLMLPDMNESEAAVIAEADSKRIPMESEDAARDLQKIISRLGCITQIIEHHGKTEINKPVEEIPEPEKKEKIPEKKQAESAVAPVTKANVTPAEEPKYLILSGVDKRNWVVREKLAESIVEIYPNMTPEIAAGIVSQPVVKLRVKNQDEAENLGEQFESMGWNIRIEDVNTVFDTQREKSRKRIDVQRRKAARMTYLKRQKRQRTNIITTIIIILLISTAAVIAYDTFIKPRYYVHIEADAAHPEVTILANGNAVFLRYDPSMTSVKHKQPMYVGEVMELKKRDMVEGEGLLWYNVKIPTRRAQSAYLREDVAYRCDKDGRRLILN